MSSEDKQGEREYEIDSRKRFILCKNYFRHYHIFLHSLTFLSIVVTAIHVIPVHYVEDSFNVIRSNILIL